MVERTDAATTVSPTRPRICVTWSAASSFPTGSGWTAAATPPDLLSGSLAGKPWPCLCLWGLEGTDGMTKTVQTLCALATLGLGGVAAAAYANDSTAQMKTGGLEFVQTDDIEMAEEKLLRVSGKGDGRISLPQQGNQRHRGAGRLSDAEPGKRPRSERGDRLRRWRNFLGFTVNQDGKDIKRNCSKRRWSTVST